MNDSIPQRDQTPDEGMGASYFEGPFHFDLDLKVVGSRVDMAFPVVVPALVCVSGQS